MTSFEVTGSRNARQQRRRRSARSTRREQIYDAVRRIPRGRVATYGQIAMVAGLEGHARQVGYALHDLEEESDVPWHRVINAHGRISARAEPFYEKLQRRMLEAEGVRFDGDGQVSLAHFGWEDEPSLRDD